MRLGKVEAGFCLFGSGVVVSGWVGKLLGEVGSWKGEVAGSGGIAYDG